MELRKEARVFVKLGFTDMRKQINGLAAIVQDLRPEGPFDGSYYVFCGKTRRVTKILYWDKTGFCLLHRKRQPNVSQTHHAQRYRSILDLLFENRHPHSPLQGCRPKPYKRYAGSAVCMRTGRITVRFELIYDTSQQAAMSITRAVKVPSVRSVLFALRYV